MILNSYYKASIIQLSKPDKNITQRQTTDQYLSWTWCKNYEQNFTKSYLAIFLTKDNTLCPSYIYLKTQQSIYLKKNQCNLPYLQTKKKKKITPSSQ